VTPRLRGSARAQPDPCRQQQATATSRWLAVICMVYDALLTYDAMGTGHRGAAGGGSIGPRVIGGMTPVLYSRQYTETRPAPGQHGGGSPYLVQLCARHPSSIAPLLAAVTHVLTDESRMASAITFDTTRHRAVLTFHGPQTYHDLITVLELLHDAPQRDPTIDLLWDLRDATLDLHGNEVYRLSMFGKELLRGSQHRMAVVVSGVVAYGMGRMAQTYAEVVQYPGAYAVFRDMAEAEAWLAGDR
jgi:hypothetical protein